jgi:hypothetical protein
MSVAAVAAVQSCNEPKSRAESDVFESKAARASYTKSEGRLDELSRAVEDRKRFASYRIELPHHMQASALSSFPILVIFYMRLCELAAQQA